MLHRKWNTCRFGQILSIVLLVAAYASPSLAANYSENFAAGAPGWTRSGGTWTATSGTYNNADGAAARSLSLYGGSTWATNYRYEAKVYNQYNAVGNRAGVVYNYVDANNYYQLTLGGNSPSTVTIYKVISGTTTTSTASLSVSGYATWFTVDVVRNGTATTIKVNGATIFNNVSQPELGAGKIGLLNIFTQGKFDDVSVTSTAAPCTFNSTTIPSGNSVIAYLADRVPYGIACPSQSRLCSNGSLSGSYTYASCTTLAPNSGHYYPRLGEYLIGGAQNYDASFRTYASKVHLNVINGNWEGWEQQKGYSKEAVTTDIKSQSTIASKVFQYVNLNESPKTTAAAWFRTWLNKINAMNWWLYNNGTSGTITPSPYDASWGLVNMTAAAPRDSATGLGPYGWGANYVNNLFHVGSYAGTSAAPSLDGFFVDNLFWKPRVSGDWDRNGSLDSASDATVQLNFRTGEKEFFTQLNNVFGSGQHLGNVADWYGANDSGTNVAPLSGLLRGGVLESAVGSSNSLDVSGGSLKTQQVYKFTMDAVLAPKYLIFGHDRIRADGSDPSAFDGSGNPTAYYPAWQGMRYGLGLCLMGEGYYFANTGPSYNGDTPAGRLWFDEYDGGGMGVGYLGEPLTSASGGVQTSAWLNGVWKREFKLGVVLWNPKGNGVRVVSLAGLGNLKRLSGSQNPGFNNGAAVTSVTLQDRDAVILLRY